MIDSMATSPTNRISFFAVMFEAIAHPSTDNYRSLARNSEASVGKAYLWVVITAVVSSIITILLRSSFPANPRLNYLYEIGDRMGRILGFAPRTPGFGSTTTSLLFGVLQVAIISLISFAITSGLLHLIARQLGGKGAYGELAFLLAALSAPFEIYSSLASAIPSLGCIGVLDELYLIVLQVLAIYGVYQFSLGKAVGTVMISFIAGFLVLLLKVGLAPL